MSTVRVTCEGISPFLMDHMSRQQLIDDVRNRRPGARKSLADVPLEEEAAPKVYRQNGPGSPIGIPSKNLLACLKHGGKRVTLTGRQRVTKSTGETLLFTMLTIDEFFIPLTGPVDPKTNEIRWEVDVDKGKQKSGQALCHVRPRLDEWGFTCTVDIDDEEATHQLVREIFNKAGKCYGLGAFNPLHGGPYGRFKVVAFEVIEDGNGVGSADS